jgi:hypothetical protein
MFIGEFNLIQQTQYTRATPKYNFPHPPPTFQLPQRLLELSLRSLKKAQHYDFFQQENIIADPSQPNHGEAPCEAAGKTLEPNPTKTSLVAIDVSSIKLGETLTGTLLAIRGAVIWKQDNCARYVRLGPFPFHITEKNQSEICDLRQTSEFRACQKEGTLPNIYYVQTRLTALLERWIQGYVNQTTHDALMLWDGSLTTGNPETSPDALERVLKEARSRRNTVLAFSKMTRLLLNGQRITHLAAKQPSPCLLKIEGRPAPGGSLHLLGNIFVAKLSPGSCAFRLDVDKALPYEQVVDAVQRLLGNDVVSQSYPDVLRMAHIYSTFTANEVLGLQRCLVKEGNLRIVERPNIRRLLFDRFGKGFEG